MRHHLSQQDINYVNQNEMCIAIAGRMIEFITLHAHSLSSVCKPFEEIVDEPFNLRALRSDDANECIVIEFAPPGVITNGPLLVEFCQLPAKPNKFNQRQ